MSQSQQLNPNLNVEPKNSPPRMASFVFNQLTDTIRGMLNDMVTIIVDLVYPTLCAHCLRVGAPLCHHCQANIVPLDPQQSKVLVGFIDGYTAVGMHTGALRSPIHALKFYQDKRQAEVLGALLAQQVEKQRWSFDIIIPVPLHLNRLKERGYNQAERIAHFLSLHLENQTVLEALQKIQDTTSQVGKSSTERSENVKDAFVVAPQFQAILVNKTVLLIDDVCTTGSTLQVCTVALRDAGVKAVYVATASRAQGAGYDS